MDEWERQYNVWCHDKYVLNKTTNSAITQEYVGQVIDFLKNDRVPEQFDRLQKAAFKHKIRKEKKYSWCTVPAVGNLDHETILTVPAKGGNGTLPVVPVEKFFTTLKSLHENAGHARITTMWKKVTAQYAGLPKSAVVKFLEGCIGCQCRAPQINQAEPQQIVASEVFSRVQVDLIDMTMKPSSEFKYIVHLMDHFSKFHLVSPLERKTASGVNSVLTRMFGTIGLPHIVQTDNGSEFARIADIFKDWPGSSDVRIIHGRPRHPQSQGLVERGHQLIQDKLAIAEGEWLGVHDGAPFLWHERLPVIQYQVNSAHSTVINNTPYEVVFGRKPKPTPLFGRDGIIIEDGEQENLDHSYSTAYESDQSLSEVDDVQQGPSSQDTDHTAEDVQQGPSSQDTDHTAEDVQQGPSSQDTDHTAEDVQQGNSSQDTDFTADDVQQGPSSQDTDHTADASQTEVDDVQQGPSSQDTDHTAEDVQQGPSSQDTDHTAEDVQQGNSSQDTDHTADDVQQGPSSQDTDHTADASQTEFEGRHEKIRQFARQNTEKANEKRKNPRKRGKRVDAISVGSFITVAVPKEDRHRSDQRRLPGIVVEKRGGSRGRFKIRCQYGVIDGWYGADMIQLFKGQLDLMVEGWETCEVLPLRTAAARHRGTSQEPSRCRCKGGCKDNQCPCKRLGNFCDATCHAGKPCSNRILLDEQSDCSDQPDVSDDPQTLPRVTLNLIQPLIDSLKDSGFNERECEHALNILSGIAHPDMLRYMASELELFMPTFPVEKPCTYRASDLLQYGSGYMKFMPAAMRTSHNVYNVSDADNRCLYNSVSLVLYGNECNSGVLKLCSALIGIKKMDRIVQEVLHSVTTSDDVIAWAAGFASDAIMGSLTGDPESMVFRIVESELVSSVSNNDSGPVQIIAVAYLLERQIEIHCCEENSEPIKSFGQGLEKIVLIRVPLSIESVDGQIRYNHFVPAIQRTEEEEGRFVSRCGAADTDVCNFSQDRPGLEWAQCDDCGRWYHTLCLVDSTRGHTMKRLKVLRCGCLRNGPFRTNRTSILTELKSTNRVLSEQRPFFKALLVDICNKRVPSWRANFYRPNVNNNMRLGRRCGATFPAEDVTISMWRYIEQQMPGPVNRSYVEYVLFPELLIRLFMLTWDINKVEAEYMISQLSAGNM